MHRPGRRGVAPHDPTSRTWAPTGSSAPAPRVRSTRPRRRPTTSPRRGPRCGTTASTRSPSGQSNSARAPRPHMCRSRRAQLGTTPSRIQLVQSDTDRTGFDTGAFASAGLFVAGNAVQKASTALRDRILGFAAAHAGVDVACLLDGRRRRALRRHVRLTLAELLEAARARGIRFTEARKAYGSPRSVTSNAHGFRIAVHRVTGEIRILYSVQATDAGVVINPQQVRGQIEGGVAQGHRIRADRELPRRRQRGDGQPQPAQLPHPHLRRCSAHRSASGRDRTTRSGRWQSKGIAECNINPVAPALANALQDATGVRYRELPLTPERIYSRLDSSQADSGDLSREKAMDTKKPTDTAATVIIGQQVRAGTEQAFEAWQQEMNSRSIQVPRIHRRRDQSADRCSTANGSWSIASTRSRMFRRGSTAPRGRSGSPRVSSTSTARAPSRSSAAARGRPIPWSPSSSRTASSRRTWTSSSRGRSDFGWRRASFDGFRGTELFRPVEGIQEEWTALYRYENRRRPRQVADIGGAQDTSRRGREVLRLPPAHHRQLVRQLVRLRRTRQPRRRRRRKPRPPSRSGSASIPTVVMLTLALSPLKMPLWLGLLIGNLLSSFVVSFVTMPYYVNPLLKHWLRPPPDVSEGTRRTGGASPSSSALMTCSGWSSSTW